MADAQTAPTPEAATTELERDDFESRLDQEFRLRSAGDEEKRAEIENAMRSLALSLKQTDIAVVPGDAIRTIHALVRAIDERLTAQINEVLHHQDFQKMEGAWRGLYYLCNNTESDEMLKIRVMNISKDELGDTLARYEGARWDVSPIFKTIYGAEYDKFGGTPYGCLVADYEFDHRPQNVRLLRNMAKICGASHVPFFSAASPELLEMESWQELADKEDLASIVESDWHTAWRSLREDEDACYLGLTLPRFLARLPYGENTEPVREFNFEEDTASGDHHRYCWANSAYAMAVNVNRSFKEYGWCSLIRGVESGGLVKNLPVHTFPSDDGGTDTKCPTEIAIGDRREGELSKLGLLGLLHRKNSDVAAFFSAQSLRKPAEYYDPDATANANLSARLPYLFAACRFAHYLKSIVRDKIGSFKEREDMEQWLQQWINNYVVSNPALANDEMKARKPLAAAQVQVEADEDDPGWYRAKFHIRPHYQLEGVDIALSLVSKLPQEKGV